jgi:hypothetical protein
MCSGGNIGCSVPVGTLVLNVPVLRFIGAILY